MFIGRKPDGTIYGMWTCKQPKDADHHGIEELADDHPDVVAFLTRPRILAGTTIEDRLATLETKVDVMQSATSAIVKP